MSVNFTNPNTRVFTFRTGETFDSNIQSEVESIGGVVSSSLDKVKGEYFITIEFDPSMLMEISDDLGALGFPEVEQEIFELNYDLISEEE